METIPQPTTVPPAFLQMKKSLQTEFRAFCCRLKDSHPVWEMVFKLSLEEIVVFLNLRQYTIILLYAMSLSKKPKVRRENKLHS